MKRGNKIILSGIGVCVVLTVLSFLLGRQDDVNESQPQKKELIQKMQNIQVPFIANENQIDERVAFFTNTFGGSVFVTTTGEIVYSLPEIDEKITEEKSVAADSEFNREKMDVKNFSLAGKGQDSAFEKQRMIEGLSDKKWSKRLILREVLVGGKAEKIRGEGKTAVNVSYFKGNDPSKWKNNISTYEALSLGEVYKGIELKLKAYGNNVEKLFYVQPDTDPEQINIMLNGVNELRTNQDGLLEAKTERGTIKFTKPVAYQEIDGKRVAVDCEYVIRNREVSIINGMDANNEHQLLSSNNDDSYERHIYGFRVAAYDRTKVLIIDPLLASIYLGGLESDFGHSIAIDADKNVIVSGYTMSADFPITAAVFGVSYSRNDIFVSKFSGDLKRLIASTFVGGVSDDFVRSMVVDSSKNIYIVGQTSSSDFPVTFFGYDTAKRGSSDAFILKLGGDLTSILAATFLGGSGDDYVYSIVLGKGGVSVYVTGGTSSSDFPTTPGAYSTSFHDVEAFVSKLDSNLTSLIASTLLGGANIDYGTSITYDSARNIYVCGNTYSTDFPVSEDAYDTSFNGGFGDIFISKFDRDLKCLLASTYLGGATDDFVNCITLDSRDNVYVTGQTESPDFPVSEYAYDTLFNNGDVFVTKLNWKLNTLLASTFLGGVDNDVGNSLAIGTDGKIFVVGYTGSTDFPVTPGAYCTSKGVLFDAFITKLSTDLTKLIASTLLGGSYRDIARSIAVDSSGNIYVVGETRSPDFPTTPGSFDASYNGDTTISYAYDAFVSKLDNNLSALSSPAAK